MKNLLFIATLLLTGYFGFAQHHVYVKGYYRSNGTYVQPHYRTAPNNTVNDNWSTRGNINPYTGKAGTKPRQVTSYSSNSSNRKTYNNYSYGTRNTYSAPKTPVYRNTYTAPKSTYRTSTYNSKPMYRKTTKSYYSY